ncbi:MAG: DNA cytosine methyltransferase [Brevundimonas sp.]|nr:MAG: DNA cytosine methyltransferase [Brevundimonas sp.]
MPIRPPARPSLTAFEFFAGGGLAGLGLEAGGFRSTFANDFDAAKARSFRTNHPGTPMVEGDVWGLSAADLPGRPDLCWASSPCQDLSLAGARKGLEGVRSGAFWGFWRLIQALDAEGRGPRALVIENVAGLLSSNQGRDFAAVCTAMAEAGFRVGALEIDAALWLPQSRPRLFIVGLRGVEGPERTAPALPFHSDRLVAAHAALPQAVRDAWAWWSLDAPPRRNADLAALLEPDPDWLDANASARLFDLAAPLHRARIEAATTPGAAFLRIRTEHGVKRQRLEARFDGLAGCLRTPAGGSSRQFVVAPGPDGPRLRRLTAREAARLMGCSEDYVLPKSQSAGLKLMGDAVAVPVVRALAERLLAPALTGARAAA